MREKGMRLLIEDEARRWWKDQIDFPAVADSLVAHMREEALARWHLRLPRTLWKPEVEFRHDWAVVTFVTKGTSALRFTDIEYELIGTTTAKLIRYRHELI